MDVLSFVFTNKAVKNETKSSLMQIDKPEYIDQNITTIKSCLAYAHQICLEGTLTI